jgi:hypothetical protein
MHINVFSVFYRHKQHILIQTTIIKGRYYFMEYMRESNITVPSVFTLESLLESYNNKTVLFAKALVYDRGTIYPVMEVKAGEMELSMGQLYGGAKLLHDPLGDRYLIEKIIRLLGIIAGMSRADGRQEKADQLRDTVTALLEMREEWRHANGT